MRRRLGLLRGTVAATTLLLGLGVMQFVGTLDGASASVQHVIELRGDTALRPARWVLPRSDTVSFRNAHPAVRLPWASGQPTLIIEFTDGRQPLRLAPGATSAALSFQRPAWYRATPVLGTGFPVGLGDLGYLAPTGDAPLTTPPPARTAPGTATPRARSGGSGSGRRTATPATPGNSGSTAGSTPAPTASTATTPSPDSTSPVAVAGPRIPPVADTASSSPARSARLAGGLLALLVVWALVVRALLHERRTGGD